MFFLYPFQLLIVDKFAVMFCWVLSQLRVVRGQGSRQWVSALSDNMSGTELQLIARLLI